MVRDASYDPLRWTSLPEASYLFRYSLDLKSWITFRTVKGSSGTDTTFSFSPPHLSPHLDFRFEK